MGMMTRACKALTYSSLKPSMLNIAVLIGGLQASQDVLKEIRMAPISVMEW
jgi:hypothetical protein